MAETRIESVLRRVESLERAGAIDRTIVRTWPGRISRQRPTGGNEAVETFDRFRTWASENDVRIEPPFSVSERRSAITGERDTVVYTPVICLAVYEGDRLVEVAPRVEGGKTVSIDDFLRSRRIEHELDGEAETDPDESTSPVIRGNP